jgi:hypothetical protein
MKAMTDLTWSSDGSTFVPIIAADATLASSETATDGTAAAVFFRTLYNANFSHSSNRPGTYDIPVVFTLSAP